MGVLEVEAQTPLRIQKEMLDEDKKDCSVIGKDLIVNGEIKCKSDLIIEGQVEGNIIPRIIR